MRRSYFLMLAACWAVSVFGLKAADVALADFESPTSIGAFANGSMWTGATGVLSVGANPVTTGLNTTAQAAYGVRKSTQGATFQAEFNIPTANYNGVKYFHIMVYKPKQSKMELRGRQNAPVVSGNTWDDRFTVKSLYSDVENQWVDVVFKYDFAATNMRIDRLVLSLDMATAVGRYTTDTNVYFDEVVVNDDPQPRGDATVYPDAKAVTFPENFEGTTTFADKRYFGIYTNWSTNAADFNQGVCYQTVINNPSKNSVNNSDKVLKMTRLAGGDYWSRIMITVNQGTGMALSSAKKFIHVMVKKDVDRNLVTATAPTDKGQVAFRLYFTDNTNIDWVKPLYDYVAPDWQDVVFEIPDAQIAKTLSRIDFYPHSTNYSIPLDVYIDEIEFNASNVARTGISTDNKNIISTNKLSVSVSDKSLIINGIIMEDASLSIYNMQGMEVVSLKNISTNIISNNLAKGVYLVKINNSKGEEKVCKFMN